LSVELVSVGNELLIGKTVNTNANWLAKRITTLGLKVTRITTVGDDVDEISKIIKECLSRRPKFIIVTGGLGPTFDDKTLEGIAKALNMELKVNDEALRMIEEKYKRYVKEGRIESFELTPYRVKMATLPEGGTPIPNPVGTAPGVRIKSGETEIIALPGVPEEMKAIFDEHIAPLVRKASKNAVFYEVSLLCIGIVESDLAPLIDKVMHDNPYVYVKSHPKAAEAIPKIEIHLSTTSDDVEKAKARISSTIMQLTELIEKKGGNVRPIKT